jgi:hypothetical protein
MVEIDHASGELWTRYATLSIGKHDPAIDGDEHANNMTLRIHSGD